jgi:hypothetical protein
MSQCVCLATAPTSSISGTAALSPANVPFTAQLAQNSGAAVQARLTSEDGVRLDVGLASVNGVTPPPVSGQVSGNQIGFPSVVSKDASGASIANAPVDFALRQTHAGVDAHLTLRSAAQGGSVVFNLTPGAGSFVERETNGQVLVRTPQQFCGNEAPMDCLTIDAANYEIGVPVVRDSSSDPAAAVLTAPVVTSLITAATQRSWAGRYVSSTLHLVQGAGDKCADHA